MKDLNKTQHFTENYKEILYNINFFPKEAVDPFAGNCDLVKYSPNTQWELYDIDVKKPEVIYNDSLLNPIDYTGKTVITNPPYLAKNKTKEFSEIFEKYNTDDLYKASILSILNCKNGILIIPINFFTDENSKEVRKKFLSTFKVKYVNYFTYQVFENTTYNVCSFYFERGKTDTVEFYNAKEKSSFITVLKEEQGYRLGGDFYDSLKDIKPVFSRLTKENKIYSTNIYVDCLDKRKEKIKAIYKKEKYIGDYTDRIKATLVCKEQISEEKQRELVERFNDYLQNERKKYNNLILTNYRDFGRKRISLENVYKIFTKLKEENDGKRNG